MEMAKLTEEELREIFSEENQNTDITWKGDNAIQGLAIIGRYFDPNTTTILTGADYDIIYSVGVEDILEAGFTEYDALELNRLNWMIESESDCLACFV